jgi:hypothetical protein
MLGFEELTFSPAEIRIRKRVEDRVLAFLQERARALVPLLVRIPMLLGLHLWAGSHIVIIFVVGHMQDASAIV